MKSYDKLRKQTGLNQSEFWNRVGVTQSGGSRYENGREPSKPVQMLIAIAYGSATERKAALKRLGV